MAYTDISGSKLRRKLGSNLNESASENPISGFAMRQMVKMGWEKGSGLGKDGDGMISHIRVKKREDHMGLGQEKVKIADASNMWWAGNVSETLARLSRQKSSAADDDGGDKKSKKKKKKKKSKDKDKDDKKKKKKKKSGSEDGADPGEPRLYTDAELFEATGGARFGMRSQRRAEAKWARTESGLTLKGEEELAKDRFEWNGLGNAAISEERRKRKRDDDADDDDANDVDDDKEQKSSPLSSEKEVNATEEDETGSRKEKKRRKKEKKRSLRVKERRGL